MHILFVVFHYQLILELSIHVHCVCIVLPLFIEYNTQLITTILHIPLRISKEGKRRIWTLQ